MYISTVGLLLFILPVASILTEIVWFKTSLTALSLTGQWFVFWSVGVRLFIAGTRQIIQPGYTAKKILGIEGSDVFLVVRELGFANVSLGLVGIVSLWKHTWVLPGALAGGLFYGMAGLNHLFKKERNRLENVATYSDLFIFVILVGFFVLSEMMA